MINQIFILLAEEPAGGLFDFGATLPFIVIQFLLLMFILNLILYSPLIKLVNQRNEYVLDNLSKASEILIEANELVVNYEAKLQSIKVQTQQEIEKTQKVQKENFAISLATTQKYLNFLSNRFTSSLNQSLEETCSELPIYKVFAVPDFMDTLAYATYDKLFLM
jgi:F-type H+-transporting ATPase subunit b